MQRGEIWWVDLAPPIGRRPVLLLSRNSVYEARASVTVALITRTIRNIPFEVRLGPNDGMPAECVMSAGDIMTIHKTFLHGLITTISPQKMAAVAAAVKFALDLP